MKRIKYPGLSDLIVVDDAYLIRALAEDPRLDRVFERRPFWNGLILGRRLGVLSYEGRRFPHMKPFADPGRVEEQMALWEWFNARASTMAEGSEDLDRLARWIREEDGDPRIREEDGDPGVLVQQVIGSLFRKDYRATGKSWAAAVTMITASNTRNLPRLFWWYISGRISRARRLLGALAGDDLVCIHGTTVAVHNLVASVRRMKELYANEGFRRMLEPERVVDLCLSAPPVVLRQATADGEAGGCPFSKYSLFLLKLGRAGIDDSAKDLIFMSGYWSRCPAERWVPAMLAGLWKRACIVPK